MARRNLAREATERYRLERQRTRFERIINHLAETGFYAAHKHGGNKGTEIKQELKAAAKIVARMFDRTETLIEKLMGEAWMERDGTEWDAACAPPSYEIREDNKTAWLCLSEAGTLTEDEAERQILRSAGGHVCIWNAYLEEVTTPLRDSIERMLDTGAMSIYL